MTVVLTSMTPAALSHLLSVYYRCSLSKDLNEGSTTFVCAATFLEKSGYIKRDSESEYSPDQSTRFGCTPKGEALVEALLKVSVCPEEPQIASEATVEEKLPFFPFKVHGLSVKKLCEITGKPLHIFKFDRPYLMTVLSPSTLLISACLPTGEYIFDCKVSPSTLEPFICNHKLFLAREQYKQMEMDRKERAIQAIADSIVI